FAAIRQAFLKHHVVFFRDQELTPDQHKAFCRRFGTLDLDRFVVPLPGHPEILEVVKAEGEKFAFGNSWHADVTFYERPPLGSVLYALEVPPYGGDTLFVNMHAVYDMLSPGMQRMLEGLNGVHSARYSYGQKVVAPRFKEGREMKLRHDREDEAQAEVIHPVVRTHPETGRKGIFVNPVYTVRIDGMTDEESKAVLAYVYDLAMRPEFSCRFAWRKHTVAFWDNRCVWHYANNDYHGFRRVMHRVTIDGDRPR
ncbi:MAG: TauD/TfdA family dioxygenase, partial [Alphaproteobacteria bacterium]|nr:TauD/TfdA family dioxygenase [Alphaproteobacteria bacterium]